MAKKQTRIKKELAYCNECKRVEYATKEGCVVCTEQAKANFIKVERMLFARRNTVPDESK